MNEFSLQRTGGDPLKFHGTLLKQLESVPDVLPAGSRYFELSVYALEDGGYVASLNFRTSVENEAAVHLAERLDSWKDVENFFFAVEPVEFLEAAPPYRALEPTEQRDLLRRLFGLYDEQVRAILAVPASENEGIQDSPSNHESAAVREAAEAHSDAGLDS